MKNKVLGSLLLITALWLAPSFARAETRLYYTINKDNTAVTVTGCDKSATELAIPEEIDGLPIKYIDDDAFRACTELKNINLPDGLVSIGRAAFSSCRTLQSIVIPDSVISIRENAFDGCNSLQSVKMSEKVTVINSYTFRGCQSLTDINIPDGVRFIDTGAFNDCQALTEINIPASVKNIYTGGVFIGCGGLDITVSGDSPYYSSFDGVLFNKDKTELLQYAKDKIQPDYDIPDSVTAIGDCAFHACYNMRSVSVPESVTKIGHSAFKACIALKEIYIPDGVTNIRYNAFADCINLTDIRIPEGVEVIDNSLFNRCLQLKRVNLPKSIKNIGEYVFNSCGRLTDIYYAGSREEWSAVNMDSNCELPDRALIHFNNGKAEVNKSETDTEYIFDVAAETSYESVYVYAAVYDEGDRLITVGKMPLDISGNARITVGKSENDSYVVVFVWTDDMHPITFAEKISLNATTF